MNDNISRHVRDDVNVLTTSLKGFRGNAWHIEVGGKHFAISAISNEFGTETMAFAADKDGNVTSWVESAMVHGQDHKACIAELLGKGTEDAR
jgi:hypothetical protein